jgi:LPXTG-site transpeptidase (sortase) family protein
MHLTTTFSHANKDTARKILEGTDDLSLNRGVGHVTGTANPGENGNLAIVGHRDAFIAA